MQLVEKATTREFSPQSHWAVDVNCLLMSCYFPPLFITSLNVFLFESKACIFLHHKIESSLALISYFMLLLATQLHNG